MDEKHTHGAFFQTHTIVLDRCNKTDVLSAEKFFFCSKALKNDIKLKLSVGEKEMISVLPLSFLNVGTDEECQEKKL